MCLRSLPDDLILVHADFLPLLEQIRERIERPVQFMLLCDDDTETASGIDVCGEYEDLLADADPNFAFPEFDELTRATTFYTTGTTGDPKGVYYSHRQLVLHTLGTMAAMGSAEGHGRFHRGDVYMPITPMFHVHAWGMPYVATMLGVKQVYPGRYTPERLFGLIERERVSFSHCVPTILHMLLSHPLADHVDLTGWKVVIGGSALPRGLATAALDRGIDVFSGYGMSETGPVLTIAHLEQADLERAPDDQLTLRCKTGRPVPLVELRVVNEAMADVPHDGESTGEVVVRAPCPTCSGRGRLRSLAAAGLSALRDVRALLAASGGGRIEVLCADGVALDLEGRAEQLADLERRFDAKIRVRPAPSMGGDGFAVRRVDARSPRTTDQPGPD